MKIKRVEVDRIDNGDYIDLDVIVTIDDKYNSQYRWSPFVEVLTGTFCIGNYEFAESSTAEWQEIPQIPAAVKAAHIEVLRKVADELGVSHLRVQAVMTQHYDLDTLGVAGSNENQAL